MKIRDISRKGSVLHADITEAVQFERVISKPRERPGFSDYSLGEARMGIVSEIFDAAATGADDVMMIIRGVDYFIVYATVEMYLFRNSSVFECSQRPVESH